MGRGQQGMMDGRQRVVRACKNHAAAGLGRMRAREDLIGLRASRPASLLPRKRTIECIEAWRKGMHARVRRAGTWGYWHTRGWPTAGGGWPAKGDAMGEAGVCVFKAKRTGRPPGAWAAMIRRAAAKEYMGVKLATVQSVFSEKWRGGEPAGGAASPIRQARPWQQVLRAWGSSSAAPQFQSGWPPSC